MSYDPGQPSPYGQQTSPYGYQQQSQQQSGSGLAVTALVLGIVALLLSWTVLGGILLGLPAVIVGFLASRRARRGAAGGRGMAITGIVLGALSILIAVAVGVLAAIGVTTFLNSDSGRNLQECLQDANGDQVKTQQCQRQFEREVVS